MTTFVKRLKRRGKSMAEIALQVNSESNGIYGNLGNFTKRHFVSKKTFERRWNALNNWPFVKEIVCWKSHGFRYIYYIRKGDANGTRYFRPAAICYEG